MRSKNKNGTRATTAAKTDKNEILIGLQHNNYHIVGGIKPWWQA